MGGGMGGAGGEKRAFCWEINWIEINNHFYLPHIFVTLDIQPFLCAFSIVPNIGEARQWVVARLRPRNIDDRCYDWQQQQRHETWDFVVASDRVPGHHRHATDGAATLVRTLWVPNASSGGAVGAHRWPWKRKCHAIAMPSYHEAWSGGFYLS